jgi:hypothetical protein
MIQMHEAEPYFAVLWSRWKVWNLEDLEETFRKEFTVTRMRWIIPDSSYDFQFGGHLTRYEIRVDADSLHALLSSVRAVLYQKTPQSFTAQDDKLYGMISEIYYCWKRMLPFLQNVELGKKWRLHR